MNCSEASSLFSARVDNELESEIAFRLEDHLDQCGECQSQWTRFYATIRMVRGLPKEETHPAFVGQVLDRVRSYEAEGDPFLEPVDRPFVEPAATVRRVSWFEMARESVQTWLRPVPALAVGSLALGVGIGLVAFDQDEQIDRSGPLTGGTITTASADIAPASNLDLALPFADIADEVRISESAESVSTFRSRIDPNAAAGTFPQQVRLGNDAPRITF